MESLFYLWRITGKQKYREWAWHIFRALHRWCPVRNGAYTSLNSILQVGFDHAIIILLLSSLWLYMNSSSTSTLLMWRVIEHWAQRLIQLSLVAGRLCQMTDVTV